LDTTIGRNGIPRFGANTVHPEMKRTFLVALGKDMLKDWAILAV